jgi:hypothetical protein
MSAPIAPTVTPSSGPIQRHARRIQCECFRQTLSATSRLALCPWLDTLPPCPRTEQRLSLVGATYKCSKPRCKAATTAWVRSVTPRRWRITLTCDFTVASVIPRRAPMSLLPKGCHRELQPDRRCCFRESRARSRGRKPQSARHQNGQGPRWYRSRDNCQNPRQTPERYFRADHPVFATHAGCSHPAMAAKRSRLPGMEWRI